MQPNYVASKPQLPSYCPIQGLGLGLKTKIVLILFYCVGCGIEVHDMVIVNVVIVS